MREIVLDTESTGLNPDEGHRVIEIGCLELKNHVPTGRKFHVYINPGREVPADAMAVHGLSYEFLKKHPPFSAHVDDFLRFIQDAPLVIHNAKFDMKFLNAELRLLNRTLLSLDRAIDTLDIARRKFPGAPASLDALCKRFKIDNSNRSLHGALLDAELLAEVYIELLGGRQPALLGQALVKEEDLRGILQEKAERPLRPARQFSLTLQEEENHRDLRKKIPNSLWEKIESR